MSSPKIERACNEDTALRVLTGYQQPDQGRISDFQSGNPDALKSLFAQRMRLCQKAGNVSLGTWPLMAPEFRPMPPNTSPWVQTRRAVSF